MRAISLFLGWLLFGFIAPLSAHETWLLPATFTMPVNTEVRLELTSGMAFPVTEYAIRAERIARARLRLGGETTELRDVKRMDTALRITSSSLPRGGLVTVWIELHPRALELSDDKVSEYLDEIGAGAGTRTAWAHRRGHGKWKETYVKHAKTFVGAGEAVTNDDADESWRKPVGMGLELVPLSSPLELRAGQAATFQLLAGGKPLAGAPVGLLAEGAAARVFQTTDAEGRVSFPLARAGRTLVFAVDLRPAQDGSSWESDFTTLTLHVAVGR